MSNKRKKNEFIGDMVAADGGIQGYHRAIRRKWYVLGVLVIITLFMCLLSVNAGAASMSPFEVLETLLGISGDERSFVVIWRLRMPRVVAAIVAGAGLSIAGCVMQTTLKNPLASPSTLGVSAGATFGANLAIIVLGAGTVMNTASDAVAINNPYLVTLCAFACAAGAVLLIMALSNLRGFTPESIVLAGTALSSLFSAGDNYSVLRKRCKNCRCTVLDIWRFGPCILDGVAIPGCHNRRYCYLLYVYALELQCHGQWRRTGKEPGRQHFPEVRYTGYARPASC